MLFPDAIEGFLLLRSATVADRTLYGDRYVLEAFSAWIGPERHVHEVRIRDVRLWMVHLMEQGLQASSIRRYLTSVSAFYTWLMREDIGLVVKHPVRGIPRPRVPQTKPKALKKDQVVALLEATQEGRNPRRDKAMLLFLLDTAARTSEMINVLLEHCDFRHGRVRVMGKGLKERFVVVGKSTVSSIWLYLKEERPPVLPVEADYLFLTSDGRQLQRNSVRLLMDRLSERVGFHCHAHQFRHTAAIERLRHGMDLVSLQRFLGHTTLEMTKLYLTALQDEDVEERAKRTSPVDNWRI